MIRTIFFDLDGTLYPMEPSMALALERAASYGEREMGLARDRFKTAYDAVLALQLSAHVGTFCYHSRFIRFQLLCERLGFPLHHASRLASAYWEGYLEAIRPYEALPAVLRSLRADGLRLGVGTNMTADWQLAKLERLGLIDAFDTLVTSEEVGVEKPDPAFFRYCLEKASAEPSESLFIGDSIEHDMQGAASAAMETLWFQPDASRRTGVGFKAFGDYRELPALIREKS